MDRARYTFARKRRIADPVDFRAAYDSGRSMSRGPLKLFVRRNRQGHARLGISVPKRVGNAPRRNRIKRRLREAFRLMQHDWPGDGAWDLIVVVRPHEPLLLADYQRILSAAMVKLTAGDGGAS